MSSHVMARIGYIAPTVAYPISAAIQSEKRSNLKWDWQEMAIRDAATIPGGASLDEHGFTCVPHVSAVAEFDESTAWHGQYLDEVRDLIAQISGATDVVAIDLGLGSTKLDGGLGTVDFCHNDYTSASVGRHVAALDPERAEERLAKRFAVYNVWRLVSPPPQSKPLALCDPRSVTVGDLMPSMTHWGPADEEIYHQNALFRHNPAHRWYYYPDLDRDRMLIWKGFDSDPGLPSIVPHCAFEDPDCTGPDACRIAAHCNVYVFFDD